MGNPDRWEAPGVSGGTFSELSGELPPLKRDTPPCRATAAGRGELWLEGLRKGEKKGVGGAWGIQSWCISGSLGKMHTGKLEIALEGRFCRLVTTAGEGIGGSRGLAGSHFEPG